MTSKSIAIIAAVWLVVGCGGSSATESQDTQSGDGVTIVDSDNGADVSTGLDGLSSDTSSAVDVTIHQESPTTLPSGCLLAKELVAAVPGYSYAAGIVLDASGAVWVAYSHNVGGYHGYLARRGETGWSTFDDVFAMTRMLLTAEEDGTLTVLTDQGGFWAQLYRLEEGSWLPTTVSPPEEHRTLLSALYLGGKRYVGLYTSDVGPQLGETDAGDPPSSDFAMIPAHLSTLSGTLAASPDGKRIALFFPGTPKAGGETGLYRYEAQELTLVGADLYPEVAALLDANGANVDWLLVSSRQTTPELVLMRGESNETIESGDPEPSCSPEPFTIGSFCEKPFKQLAQPLTVTRGLSAHTFIYATENSRYRNEVISGFVGCDPVDPTGPPPICEGPPTEEPRTLVDTSNLTLLRAPTSGDAPRKQTLWSAGIQIQHLRAVKDAQGLTHLLVIGYPSNDPDNVTSGFAGSLVYYLRFDDEACFP
ncbi:MAG: hypothetical protein KC609_04370 [Myxococcales bacterium]|nr:hypothetical protein [Myxococcales bacterium]